MLKTVDGKRQLSAVTGPAAINLSFSLRSAAGVQRLSSSAAFGGGRQASTFGSSRTGGYWILAATGLLRRGFRRYRLCAVTAATSRGLASAPPGGKTDGGSSQRAAICAAALPAPAASSKLEPLVHFMSPRLASLQPFASLCSMSCT